MVKTAQTSRKRIVAVDDEEEILRLYQTFLQFRDYEVVTIRNASDCIAYLKSEPADLVLLDVDMPSINGLQLLEMIRFDERLKDLRVIMVTAKRDEETVKRAVALGCDGFIVKPFTLKDFAARVAMELISVSDEEVRGLLKGHLTMRASLFKEPGMQDWSALHWDPYPVKHGDVHLCLMLPRGVRAAYFLKALPEELDRRVIVLYKHAQRWKKLWPGQKKAPAVSA